MRKISFIIPVYNVSAYLKRCLDSIKPFYDDGNEIIIVNDGSTDSSDDIIKEFISSNKGCIYVYQDNAGLSAARNTGLNYATCNYVWFIDSDDYIDSSNKDVIYDAINHDYDTIVFGRIEEYENRAICVPRNICNVIYESGIEYFLDSIRVGSYRTNVWDKIIKRSVLTDNNIHFEEGLLYEDMFFVLQLFVFSRKTLVLPIYAYHYIKNNPYSITRTIRANDLDVLIFAKKANVFMHARVPINETNYEFQLLMFNWISSCVLNKYAVLSLRDNMAKNIFWKVMKDYYFRKSVIYCSKSGMLNRSTILAKILRVNPNLYRYILILLLNFRRCIIRYGRV